MIRLPTITLVCLAAATPSPADENPVLQGSIESITSQAWAVSGVESELELTPAGLRGEFSIGRIELKGSGQVFDDIRIACGLVGLTTRKIECTNATFTITIPGLDRQEISGSFSYDRFAKTATIELAGVAVAGGRLYCDITVSESGVDMSYRGSGMLLADLLTVATEFSDALSGYSAEGRADVGGSLAAPASGPMRIRFGADLYEVSLANDAGTVATGAVDGKLLLDLMLNKEGSAGLSLAFDSDQGEAYIEPVYANFSEHAVHLQAEDILTTDFLTFDIPRFRLQQESLLDIGGSAMLGMRAADGAATTITANVEIRDSAVSNIYESLVQVMLAGTVLDDLDTDGRLSGSVSITDNSLQTASLQLDDLILDDRRGRFAVYGLNGVVDWRNDEDETPEVSQLSWESGTAYTIVVGGGELAVQLGNDGLELLAPLRLATMGGALLINQLVLNDFGTDSAAGTLDAELEPVQLGQLTGAFGWPAFSGTLSGKLPLLQLANDTVTVGGTLSARAFDGTMEISDMRIRQPFGRVPRLQADVALRNLDLQRVTEAFSFGLIQGRLSGDITGLQMQSWRPVAMDMRFYTPPGDRSQHRITQRAVENLASVGGGGAATALSTGFMQFFEVFAYDRIGLRCLLRDGICAMSGVEPARASALGTGYYIVKGRGIPRIDVVGFRDTVSWTRLVQQLAAITRGGSPTVN